MPLHLHTPRAPLDAFIQVLWMMEGEEHAHAKERVLPDGAMEMVINLREDRIPVYDPRAPERFEERRGAVICGPHSEYMVIDTEAQARVMGVHFRPGGGFPFLGLPARELSNQTISLDDLWGEPALDLRHRLEVARTHAERFRLLEDSLAARLKSAAERHPAVTWSVLEIDRAGGSRPLAEITHQIGLSSRRFIELFSREVGLTPKRFDRVRRFQRAVQTLHGRAQIHWADLAVSCGYFDQAHFIHDFREFCGMTPAAYFERHDLRHANHVPLPF